MNGAKRSPRYDEKQTNLALENDTSMMSLALHQNGTSVSESIQRGRAALAEAEGHIRMFEEYLQSSAANLDNSSYDEIRCDVNTNNSQEEDLSQTCNYALSEHLLDSVSDNMSFELPPNVETDKSVRIIDQLMRDGEERMKRDEVIASARRNGNGVQRYCHESLYQSREKKVPRPKSKGQFDPNNLLATRRAVVKASKLSQAASGAEIDCFEVTNFKARPLPNGALVKNDPYALTKCARAKLNQIKDHHRRISPLGRDPNTSIEGSTRMDASVLLGDNYPASPSPSENPGQTFDWKVADSPRQPNKRKKVSLRKHIYKAATEVVAQTVDEFDDLNAADSNSEEQGLIDLHQQIAKLQAELKIKRLHCLETAEIFEREGQCASPLDLGIPIIGNNDCNEEENGDSKNTSNIEEERDYSYKVKNYHRKQSLYDRQKLWLKRKEEKRRDAIEREEKHKVKDVTGKPDLAPAKKSWSKAKEEHDKLVEIAKKREQIIQSEKEDKYKEQYLKKMREAEGIQNLAKEKSKAMKKGIDRDLQAEYIDKLSRPIHRVQVERTGKNRDHDGEEKEKQKTTGKTQEISQGREKKAKTTSFADMDDKEFAKIVKKIQSEARKSERKVFEGIQTGGGKYGDNTLHETSGVVKTSPYKRGR